jgi:hypothetical protein
MPVLTAVLLAAWFTLPSLLTLLPAGYDHMGLAHGLAFLGAVLALDRLARKAPDLPPAVGAAAGALPAMVGATAGALIAHTPAATAALVADLARFRVPPRAGEMALALHWRVAALLAAGTAGAFYGGLGALFAWWRRTTSATGDPST